MTGTPSDVSVLDEAHATFIQRRVAVIAASRDADSVPSLARVYGCRVSSDRRAVTLFLSIPQSEALLRDLRGGAPIAVVFSLPSTHQTLQLKGRSTSVGDLQDGDRALMQAYGESLKQELGSLGYPDRYLSPLASGANDPAVTVTFAPTDAFVQTPGPSAGQPLGRKS